MASSSSVVKLADNAGVIIGPERSGPAKGHYKLRTREKERASCKSFPVRLLTGLPADGQLSTRSLIFS